MRADGGEQDWDRISHEEHNKTTLAEQARRCVVAHGLTIVLLAFRPVNEGPLKAQTTILKPLKLKSRGARK